MKCLWILFSLFLITLSNNDSEKVEIQVSPPLHFAMEKEWQQVLKIEPVISFSNADSLGEHHVSLLSDSTNHPLLFYSEIKTPVCIDGLCKPLHICIYWNLLGNYVGFGLLNKEVLTKYDHEAFEVEDYLKLHELLLNEKSVLREKRMSDLYHKNAKPQKQIKFKGIEVDGMTGATKKEIMESIVEGALYSCFTLWHLVHGGAKDEMKEYFGNHLLEGLKIPFLYSPYADYQFFALKSLSKEEFKKHSNQVLKIYKSAKPLVRTYILKKMPFTLWKEASICKNLFLNFSQIDIQSKTLLIKKLGLACNDASKILSTQIQTMSKNQLKLYLKYLASNREFMDKEILKNLQEVADKNVYPYSYLLKSFLD